jgi:hypothetical protein
MTMWTIQEFCDATNSYGVRIVKLIAPPPATPASSSPSNVANNQSSVTVTLTGSSSAGSGFFDPGAGFANHISASATGGIVVNGIAYINPTMVTLDLNTTGVAAGNYDFTVTNPDGQNATGTAILTVTSSAPTATTTTLSSNLNPAVFGSVITFTATVSPATATGTITFMDGASTLGTASLASGSATFSTASLAAGSHSITAVYGGDVNNAGSTSPILSQTVMQKKRRGQIVSPGFFRFNP